MQCSEQPSTLTRRAPIQVGLSTVVLDTNMYPEIHPLTGSEFHEREDVGHVFKVYI